MLYFLLSGKFKSEILVYVFPQVVQIFNGLESPNFDGHY